MIFYIVLMKQVFDELDRMFDLGFGPNIKKILTSVKQSTSRPCNQKCQSVVATSTLIKVIYSTLPR